MESLNIIEHITPRFGVHSVALAGNSVALEETEKPFRRGVIAAVANGAHAADDVVVTQERLIFTTGELRGAGEE